MTHLFEMGAVTTALAFSLPDFIRMFDAKVASSRSSLFFVSVGTAIHLGAVGYALAIGPGWALAIWAIAAAITVGCYADRLPVSVRVCGACLAFAAVQL